MGPLHLLQMNSSFLEKCDSSCVADLHSSMPSTITLSLSAGNTLSDECYKHVYLLHGLIPWSIQSHPVIIYDTQSSLHLSHLSSPLEKFLVNPDMHALTFCSSQTLLSTYLPVRVRKFLIYDSLLPC